MAGSRKNEDSFSDEVLVGVLNNLRDLKIVQEKRWYRIPVANARRWIANRWPPKWLAFYQTKVFEKEAYGIFRYAQIAEIREVTRKVLFPEEPRNAKTDHLYYQLLLAEPQLLATPILSRRWRRIVFIKTTWRKFQMATEINDLFDESPLEDRLWAELKAREISAERQEFITSNGRDYALDFAFYCRKGKLDVETDGDTWHGERARIPLDNQRDNDLETGGWKLLRFNTCQLNEEMTSYCLPTIAKNLQNLGGIDDARVIPRDIKIDRTSLSQPSLFDD